MRTEELLAICSTIVPTPQYPPPSAPTAAFVRYVLHHLRTKHWFLAALVRFWMARGRKTRNSLKAAYSAAPPQVAFVRRFADFDLGIPEPIYCPPENLTWPDCPLDIYKEIIGHASPSLLSSFCRVNKWSCAVAARLLYEDVSFSIDIIQQRRTVNGLVGIIKGDLGRYVRKLDLDFEALDHIPSGLRPQLYTENILVELALENMPNLEDIKWEGTAMSVEIMLKLAKCQRLRQLSINFSDALSGWEKLTFPTFEFLTSLEMIEVQQASLVKGFSAFLRTSSVLKHAKLSLGDGFWDFQGLQEAASTARIFPKSSSSSSSEKEPSLQSLVISGCLLDFEEEEEIDFSDITDPGIPSYECIFFKPEIYHLDCLSLDGSSYNLLQWLSRKAVDKPLQLRSLRLTNVRFPIDQLFPNIIKNSPKLERACIESRRCTHLWSPETSPSTPSKVLPAMIGGNKQLRELSYECMGCECSTKHSGDLKDIKLLVKGYPKLQKLSIPCSNIFFFKDQQSATGNLARSIAEELSTLTDLKLLRVQQRLPTVKGQPKPAQVAPEEVAAFIFSVFVKATHLRRTIKRKRNIPCNLRYVGVNNSVFRLDQGNYHTFVELTDEEIETAKREVTFAMHKDEMFSEFPQNNLRFSTWDED